MSIRFKIFKIKEGKKDKWLAWCKEIMDRYDEAAGTLEEENVISEKCTIFGDYVFYVFELEEGKAKMPMDMEKPINKKHFEMMEDCLESPELLKGYNVVRSR